MAGQFSIDITRFIKRAGFQMDTTVKGLLYGLARDVVKSTPVDTGRARGNWRCSLDSIVEEPTGRLDKTGSRTLRDIAVALEDFKSEKTKAVYLTSSIRSPYIIMLEYGWSEQAPAGMVRMSLVNFKNVQVDSLGAGGR